VGAKIEHALVTSNAMAVRDRLNNDWPRIYSLRASQITRSPKDSRCREPARARWRASVVVVASSLLLSLLASGCTVLGLASGAISDVHEGRADLNRLSGMATGQRVTAWKRNGGSVAGRYAGLDTLLSETDSMPPVHHVRIRLLQHDHETAVDADSVLFVTVRTVHGKITGTLIGAAIDVTILFIAAPTSGAAQ